MQQEPICKQELRNRLINSLPPIVPRHRIRDSLGGLLSENYLANLDSDGKGPRRVKFGRKAAYLREDLIEWLLARLSFDEKEPKND